MQPWRLLASLVMLAITYTDSLFFSGDITVSNALTAFSVGGFATNHLDIAPNQSGFLMGGTNTLAAISSSASVFVSGLIQDATAAGMRCSRPRRWYRCGCSHLYCVIRGRERIH